MDQARVLHKAHRVIWKMVTEEDGEFVKHLNGRKGDNAIGNLADVGPRGSCRNTARYRNNRSGYMGVSYRPNKAKWRARISVERRDKFLGYFDTLEEAVAARKAAQRAYGYHENHGREAAR